MLRNILYSWVLGLRWNQHTTGGTQLLVLFQCHGFPKKNCNGFQAPKVEIEMNRCQCRGVPFAKSAPFAMCSIPQKRGNYTVHKLLTMAPAACENLEFCSIRKAELSWEGNVDTSPALIQPFSARAVMVPCDSGTKPLWWALPVLRVQLGSTSISFQHVSWRTVAGWTAAGFI